MATEFKIKRGLSTQLFDEHGVVNPKLIIEEGCWYLCIDTAELFLGVKVVDDQEIETFDLKRINNSIAEIVDTLSKSVATLEDANLFIEVSGISDLPSKADAEFNPYATYYQIDSSGNVQYTYKYSVAKDCYIKMASADTLGVRIASISINENGELVVVYSDGSSEVAGSVVSKTDLVSAIYVNNKLYTSTSGQIDLPDFATPEYVTEQLAALEQQLADYATKEDISKFVDEDFVKEAIIQAALGNNVTLDDYVLKSDLEKDYATKKYVADSFDDFTASLRTVVLCGGDCDPTDDL
jgi:hypothetical protein